VLQHPILKTALKSPTTPSSCQSVGFSCAVSLVLNLFDKAVATGDIVTVVPVAENVPEAKPGFNISFAKGD
jgi:hypothetical protein